MAGETLLRLFEYLTAIVTLHSKAEAKFADRRPPILGHGDSGRYEAFEFW
jgi:hypothetical protein